MNADKDDAGVQAGETREQLQERVKNSTSIYSTRKDVRAIKDRLLEVVEEKDEYWKTLASFIHGQCSKSKFDDVMKRCLKTNEMKVLHNELIRSIIYNAHFSMLPPPGVEIAKPKPNPRSPKPPIQATNFKSSSFMTYTAADLHHLPSLNQLSKRIGVIIRDNSFNIDSKAVNKILTELKTFIFNILHKSREISCADKNSDGRTYITVENVQQVLRMNSNFGRVVSPCVMSKFALTYK